MPIFEPSNAMSNFSRHKTITLTCFQIRRQNNVSLKQLKDTKPINGSHLFVTFGHNDPNKTSRTNATQRCLWHIFTESCIHGYCCYKEFSSSRDLRTRHEEKLSVRVKQAKTSDNQSKMNIKIFDAMQMDSSLLDSRFTCCLVRVSGSSKGQCVFPCARVYACSMQIHW